MCWLCFKLAVQQINSLVQVNGLHQKAVNNIAIFKYLLFFVRSNIKCLKHMLDINICLKIIRLYLEILFL